MYGARRYFWTQPAIRGKDHLIKATLESMAYQNQKDILNAMQEDAGLK